MRTVGDLKAWSCRVAERRDLQIRWEEFILDSKQSIHRLIRKLAVISVHPVDSAVDESDSETDLGKRANYKAHERPKDRARQDD